MTSPLNPASSARSPSPLPAIDYAALGFRCGLEIHQRVDSTKLFCNCYANPSASSSGAEDKIDETNCLVLRRQLRAVAGETGQVDVAAGFQTRVQRTFTYFVPEGKACAVECDDEPPHALNAQALDVALQTALALHCRVVDELHVMRKTVVDGSAVSGFQRTALLGLDGSLDTPRGPVAIPTLCLEEESAGIVEDVPDAFRLDRIGIPLIEIATDASIRDGGHARQVAEQIGAVLRSTGRVQRGLGSVRQDLNVSITGGARVEIKGAQDLDAVPLLIENEVRRQLVLLAVRDELRRRNPPLAAVEARDATHLFAGTKSALLSKALARGERAFALKLPGLRGLLGRELLPGLRFGSELAAYARAAAGVKGLIHSDEDPVKYGLGRDEIAALEKFLGAAAPNASVPAGDGWLLVAAREPVARKALTAAAERCNRAREGVPEETRRAEGTLSVFMRPLPGAARLYPETDVPPVSLAALRGSVKPPESMAEKRAKYLAWGVGDALADQLLRSPVFPRFERLVEAGASAPLAAALLLETLVSLRRDGVPVDALPDAVLSTSLSLVRSGRLARGALPELLQLCAQRPGEEPGELAAANNLERVTGSALRALVQSYREKGLIGAALVQAVMREHRLRVDASEVAALAAARERP